ncbi:hypothetical protein ACFL1B_05125 [Nanoarchaeota archaeon]
MIAEETDFIQPGKARIAQGNFFPTDFQVKRHDVEKEDKYRSQIEEHLRDYKAGDPYRDLGLSLDQVDLFYHYQVERKDNILRLISERAKPGAKLLFTASMRDTCEVPENLEEITSEERFYLYEKIH